MPEETEAKPEKKKLPIKVIGIIAVIMLLEGAGVFFFVSMTGKTPQDAMATLEGEAEAKLLEPVEIELIKGNFQNMQTGKTWNWSIDVSIRNSGKTPRRRRLSKSRFQLSKDWCRDGLRRNTESMISIRYSSSAKKRMMKTCHQKSRPSTHAF